MANELQLNEYGQIETDNGLVIARRRPQYGTGFNYLHNKTPSEVALEQKGHVLRRDKYYTLIKWDAWGSGFEDWVYEQIAIGNVGNIGVHPTPDPFFSGVLSSIVAQSSLAEIHIRGRRTPRRTALAAIGMAQDAQGDPTDFITKFTFNHFVHNRGNAVDICGVSHYSFENWEKNGLEAVPLTTDDKGNARSYYLRYTQKGRFPEPMRILPVLSFEPSGNAQWPYWVKVKKDKGHIWVLCHKNQVVPTVTNVSSLPGVGSSAAHHYMSVFAHQVVLQKEAKLERSTRHPSEGAIVFTGEDSQSVVDDLIVKGEEKSEDGDKLAQGFHISSSSDPKFGVIKVGWRDTTEDGFDRVAVLLGVCLNVDIRQYVPLDSTIYSGEFNNIGDLGAIRGVNEPLNLLGRVIMTAYPRIHASAMLPNARAGRITLQDMYELSKSVGDLPLERAEIRDVMRDQIGLSLRQETNTDSNVGDNPPETEPVGGDGEA